jgi:hypothetical protein
VKTAEAECVRVHEGSTCVIAGRDDVAPPDWSPAGDGGEGQPKSTSELRSGVGLAHSTDDAVEGNEARRGSQPGRSPGERGEVRTQSRVTWPSISHR